MNVNGVTPKPPVVYLPMQAIAPCVPDEHPMELPTPDPTVDPTPRGDPFVWRRGLSTGDPADPLDPSAGQPRTVAPAADAAASPAARTPGPIEQLQQQVAARVSAVNGFDAYA